jgi:hypothetical protein
MWVKIEVRVQRPALIFRLDLNEPLRLDVVFAQHAYPVSRPLSELHRRCVLRSPTLRDLILSAILLVRSNIQSKSSICLMISALPSP